MKKAFLCVLSLFGFLLSALFAEGFDTNMTDTSITLFLGGTAKYADAYIRESKRHGYYDNTYERAAYGFGPVNETGFDKSHAKASGADAPVLLNAEHKGWFLK